MSCKVSKHSLTRQQLLEIKNDLFIKGIDSEYGPAETLEVWGETINSIYIPNAYYKQYFKKSPNKTEFPKTNYSFTGNYKNDDQKQIVEEALNQLKTNRCTLISIHTGGGKTFSAIKLASEIQCKTAVLVHRSILTNQWVESIKKFTTATVQVVDTTGELDSNADFYIFNIAFVPRIWDSQNKKWIPKKLGQFKDIGVLIVDEAHIACASEMSKAMIYFEPRFTIGLTATPKRVDGLDKMLDFYFGQDRIIRISTTPFIVYRYSTKIKPEYTKNARGKKDWNSVVDYLIKSEKRNKMIVDIVKEFPKKTIMIMSKRVDHCKILEKMLIEGGESITVMKGTDKDYDKTARILISTFSKLGVGFDDERLDLLILACSVKEVEQYAGRLRYTEGKERIIVDLVDDDYNCNAHWLERRKWYISRKGIVKTWVNEAKEGESEKVQVIVETKKRFAPIFISNKS